MSTRKEILIAARKLIKAEKYKFICFAIMDGPGSEKEKNDVINYIGSLLGGYGIYEDWLKYHHPHFFSVNKCAYRYLTPGRVAWLNWMIKQS
jgi:hypothetical protein